MENFGADVYASPTDRTHAGRAALEQDPNNPGSLGLAISEAVEVATTSGGAKKYSLGSVLDHVLTAAPDGDRRGSADADTCTCGSSAGVEMAGEYPDFVTLAPRLRAQRASAGVGCAGGGTLRDFAGFAYPFIHQNLTNGKRAKVIAVEPASCLSITRGKYAFDWGDQAATASVVKMHTLGHTFIPPAEVPRRRPALSRHTCTCAVPRDKRGASVAPSVSALVENGDTLAPACKYRCRAARRQAVGDFRGGCAVLHGRGHTCTREPVLVWRSSVNLKDEN